MVALTGAIVGMSDGVRYIARPKNRIAHDTDPISALVRMNFSDRSTAVVGYMP